MCVVLTDIIKTYKTYFKKIEDLQEEYNCGIIDSGLLQANEIFIMQKIKDLKEKIINHHVTKFYEIKEKEGYCYTYLPNDKAKNTGKASYGKMLRLKTRNELEERVAKFYIDQELADDIIKDDIEQTYTFEDVYNMWRVVKDAKTPNPNSRKKYSSDYNSLFKGTEFVVLDMRTITRAKYELFIIESINTGGLGVGKKNKNSNTPLGKDRAKHFIGYIRNVFEFAEDEGLIDTNPMLKVKSDEMKKHCLVVDLSEDEEIQRHIYDDEQNAAILKRLREDQLRKPHYMPPYVIELDMLTGFRTGEAPSRKWSDFDFVKRVIKIDTSQKLNQMTGELSIAKTKTNKRRQYPLTDEIMHLLNRIKAVHEAIGYTGEFVFYGGIGNAHNGHHKRYDVISGRSVTEYHRRTMKLLDKERLSTLSDVDKALYKPLYVPYKGVTGHRKTVNSKLKQLGASSLMSSSMIGNSIEINNANYSYDVSNQEEKLKIVEANHRKLFKLVS